MRKTLLLLIVFLLVACSHEVSLDDQYAANFNVLEGCFTGTYERNGEGANVSLNLAEGNFEGGADKINFPAICEGYYYVSETQITFVNRCLWTADFNWALILDGSYNYLLTDTGFTIMRITEEFEEYYRLKPVACK